MTRIVVAFTGKEARGKILRLLAAEGLGAAAVCASGAEVLRAVHKLGIAIVICGFRLRDMTADSLAADLRGLAVLMVVAKAPYLELCGGENLYKLAVPASRADFFATLHLLMDAETANLRRPPSRRREEEQQIIRRAKALLMDVNRMSEADAHRFLQKRSMDLCEKLVDTAQKLIDSYTS